MGYIAGLLSSAHRRPVQIMDDPEVCVGQCRRGTPGARAAAEHRVYDGPIATRRREMAKDLATCTSARCESASRRNRHDLRARAMFCASTETIEAPV